MEVIIENGIPIKIWSKVESVEPQALQQLRNVSRLPYIFRHVAVMPDVHLGNGATVGSVIASRAPVY
jgi:tRNA-splicing ligase RtcB